MRKVIKTTNDLGGFFRSARLQSKQSIETVAKKAGFTCATVSNVENNRGSTRTETLLAIAEVIGVTVEISLTRKRVL